MKIKKTLLTIFSLIVFLYVSFLSPVAAQTKSENSATPPAKVEYELSYPGILPDNPLYFIKAARDRLVSFLINDPVKRSEFNLLTSDKRVYAAKILSDRGKFDLAINTLSKSNNYLEQALSIAHQGKIQGENFDPVLSNLKTAILKHEEIAILIKSRVDKKLFSQVQKEQDRLKNFGKYVDPSRLK
jgi:hypothetical protein